jgi:hypothetical protein
MGELISTVDFSLKVTFKQYINLALSNELIFQSLFSDES